MSNVLSRSEMRKVTLKDLYTEARASYYTIWNKARSVNRDVKLYCHWSGGRYSQFWDAYHIQIDNDGSIYVPYELPLSETSPDGTYMRNTGSIAITILGQLNMTPEAPDTVYPVTKTQIEVLAQVVTVLANALDLTIDIKRVMTHGEAADNEDGRYCHEPYGPKSGALERWDLEYFGWGESPVYDPYGKQGYRRGGDVIRGKANWYRKTGIDGVCGPR